MARPNLRVPSPRAARTPTRPGTGGAQPGAPPPPLAAGSGSCTRGAGTTLWRARGAGPGPARAFGERHGATPFILAPGNSTPVGGGAGKLAVGRKPYQLADLSRAAVKVIAEARQPPPG